MNTPTDRREFRRGWLSHKQITTAVISGVVTFLIVGLLQTQFGIFPVKNPKLSIPHEVTSTQKYLFTAYDAISPGRPNRIASNALCWIHSLASARLDAFRCQVPHKVDDPCFAAPWNLRAVLCSTAPWKNSGAVYRLTAPLPNTNQKDLLNPIPSDIENRPTYVWAVQLVNGETCIRNTGGAIGEENATVGFLCGEYGQTVGPIFTNSNLWTTTYFVGNSSQGAVVAIAKAWF